MGREDVTEDNPMGFVPPVIVPDEKEAKKILAQARADLEKSERDGGEY